MNFNPMDYGMKGYNNFKPFNFYEKDENSEVGGLLGRYLQKFRGMKHFSSNKGGPVDSTIEGAHAANTYIQPNNSSGYISTNSGVPEVSDYAGEHYG